MITATFILYCNVKNAAAAWQRLYLLLKLFRIKFAHQPAHYLCCLSLWASGAEDIFVCVIELHVRVFYFMRKDTLIYYKEKVFRQ
jgi:hypothetical protein